MAETGQRTLAAIVFTDAVGYTERVGVNEDATVAAVKQDLHLMTELCFRFEGRVVKSTGDGLMMLFSSAVNAVSCALEIQKAIVSRVKEEPDAGHLLHRIGIHLGDVLVTDDDAHGEGVNVASRLEERAEPGGICLSQTVYDVVKNRLFLEAVPIGDLTLKHVPEPVSAYRVAGVAPARKQVKPPSKGAFVLASIAVIALASATTAYVVTRGNAKSVAQAPDTAELERKISELTKIASDIDKRNEEVLKKEEELRKIEQGKPKGELPKPPQITIKQDPPSPSVEVNANPSSAAATGPKSMDSEEFQTALAKARASYDFENVEAWLQANASPENTKEMIDYAKIDDLIAWAKAEVAKGAPENPMGFRGAGRESRIMGADDEGLVMQVAGETVHKKYEELTPGQMLLIFQAVLSRSKLPMAEKTKLLEAVGLFAREYDMAAARPFKIPGRRGDNKNP